MGSRIVIASVAVAAVVLGAGTVPASAASPSAHASIAREATAEVVLARALDIAVRVSPAASGKEIDTVDAATLTVLRDYDIVVTDIAGRVDAKVTTVDEERQRTAFWTLVDLVVDLQRSWAARRGDFGPGTGSGFLAVDLIVISRLLHAGCVRALLTVRQCEAAVQP